MAACGAKTRDPSGWVEIGWPQSQIDSSACDTGHRAAASGAAIAAMESIIQTGTAAASAALFGSTEAVTPPKTLALGAAWRDALCPAHRERTALPGGARSGGLALVVAACARIESTSAQRRGALQRLVAPLAGWRRPSGALGASLASKARYLKPGDGFVAPVAAGYCAARRKADGSYDVAVSGVGAEALAWQEYRVGQDGVIERAALAVVENCDAERVVSAAAWANLAAAPAGAKRGQSDAVAAARACYAAALPFFASGRRPTHGGGFAPVLAPARQERANKAAVKQASRPNTVDAAAAALQNAVQSAGAAGALLQAQFGGSSGADKEEDASPGDDDDDDEDASGAAALLATMRFALEAKSPEDAFAAVVETRVTIACWGLAEAQKLSMDDRALKRALHAASRGLAAFATSEALAAEVLASVETASIALRDAADPPPVLAVVSGAAPVPTSFPLFDRFNEIVDEDALAGGAAAVSIVRPADLGPWSLRRWSLT